MALRPDIILAGRAPDIGAAFSNALLNVQRGQQIGQQREQFPLQNRLLEAQAGQAEAGVTEGQQLNRVRSIALFGSEIANDVQSGDLVSIRAKTVRRIAQDLPNQGVPSNDSQELLQLIDNPNLSEQEKLSQIGQISQQATALGQRFGVLEAPKAVTGTASQRDFAEFQRLQAKAQAPGASQVDIDAANQFGRQAGFTRETAQELADIKVQRDIDIAEGKAGVELETKPTIAGSVKAAEAAIKRSEKAFDQIEKIKINVNNLDEIVRLIDEGAETGFIASKLPSVRSASVQLDNLQGRLGLDVIGETTFGALSESELAFALSTALPKNLDGPDLKRWVQRKKDTQLKLSSYLEEVATFLGTPGNTTADFIELQKLRQLDQEQPPVQQPAPVEAQPAQQQILQFDAQGNLIQ